MHANRQTCCFTHTPGRKSDASSSEDTWWRFGATSAGCRVILLMLPENLTLLSPQFPAALPGKAAGRAAVRGRGGPQDPPGEVNCFNQGPMWTLTKEPGWNHRLLFCCRGSHRGWERAAASVFAPVTTAGLRFICFGDCFIPGDSKGSAFPEWYTAL